MSFQEKSIKCSDCDATFTFSIEEQEQFASRGYTNEPKRCPSCRQARKAQQNSNNGSSYQNDSYKPRREMFPAVCAECGKATQVPFQPREDRPVYCSVCYNNTKMSRSR